MSAIAPLTPFDSVPEAFDRWRSRNCDELFDCVAARAALGPGFAPVALAGAAGAAPPLRRHAI